MPIDFQSSVGRVRLRCADISDLPFLPDEVYAVAIEESNGSLPQAAKTCASYILGLLSLKTRKKMVQLEVFGDQAYSNYKDFLISTISNPSLMSYTAIPVLITGDGEANPLAQFTEDWNACWSNPENVTQMVHRLASGDTSEPWENI